jgi:hypothetical protein
MRTARHRFQYVLYSSAVKPRAPGLDIPDEMYDEIVFGIL